MTIEYKPQEIEQEVQAMWAEEQPFTVKEDMSREKFYCLSMLPYPSGDLHMGHARNYTISDMIARYQHMLGKNVLQPMGWDAFGLPAENAAIANQLPPSEWIEKNIKKMRKQLLQLGYAFDWKREINTSSAEYYRWEQWLFIQMLKKGLVYKKNAIVNWDPVDQTVLANEQVVDGKGWRSGATVERREIPQWFFKITHYADELLDSLDELSGWPEQVKNMQRNWIGRSEGVEVKFSVFKRPKQPLHIFTTRADTIIGATYIGLALEHPLAQEAAKNDAAIAKFIKKAKKSAVSESDIAQQEKLGIFTGLSAIHPITKKHLPIWITNFVLMEYGSGAIMAVPAHDQRDFEFAQQYNLPIKPVVAPLKKTPWDYTQQAYTEHGTVINSGDFDGLKTKKACKEIIKHLEECKTGSAQTHYRLRDWGISRQRYWGTPIPIVYCKHCGEVPVAEEDLPVTLPIDLIPTGQGSPLKTESSFYKTKCPNCGKAAKRETDTMDTFVESSWYYARYCCNDQNNCMLDNRAKYWTPVDQYIGGIEHAVMHLLYARFMHKVLRDEGLLNTAEPFTRLLTQGMVVKDGAKMSKSKGNTVSPTPLIKKFGADTVRLFIIFAAPPQQDLEWSESGVEGAYRFLNKVFTLAYQHQELVQNLNQSTDKPLTQYENKPLKKLHHEIHSILQQAEHDMQRQQFNTVVSAAMKLYNILSKIEHQQNEAPQLIHEGFSILMRLLSPITPHLSQHLWRHLEYGNNIMDAAWPRVNLKALAIDEVEIMIQINGKLRGKINVNANASDEEIKKSALNNEQIQQHLVEKPIKKCIIVPKRLINIVI